MNYSSIFSTPINYTTVFLMKSIAVYRSTFSNVHWRLTLLFTVSRVDITLLILFSETDSAISLKCPWTDYLLWQHCITDYFTSHTSPASDEVTRQWNSVYRPYLTLQLDCWWPVSCQEPGRFPGLWGHAPPRPVCRLQRPEVPTIITNSIIKTMTSTS